MTVAVSFLMLVILLSMIYTILHQLTSSSSSMSSASPFECGFEPMSSMRSPFSTKFFTLVVLFVVFDVEITLFFPLILNLSLVCDLYSMMALLTILVLLLGGLYWEITQDMVSWSKFEGSLYESS
uniref:NADH-ubiquinone oxidoreductase chain 3 n=1 Tax=Physidae sp. P3S_19 TaxID=2861967 RepID=A0A8F8X815_9GAST|nr:NADH dehydrogenase subunit 3 [Physidae sp. P3S_19]